MEYHEIGERFEYDGVMIKAVESNVLCFGCCFLRSKCKVSEMYCVSHHRLDKKNVIYKFVEHCKTKNTNMEQENNESKKNDRLDDKLRWELLPLEDIEDIVKVYTEGAKKYGPNTWQNLPDGYNRYKAAFFRHLLEHEKGNWLDEETGSIHLAQCVWNALAMLHIAKQNMKNNENTICSKEENLLAERKDTPEK